MNWKGTSNLIGGSADAAMAIAMVTESLGNTRAEEAKQETGTKRVGEAKDANNNPPTDAALFSFVSQARVTSLPVVLFRLLLYSYAKFLLYPVIANRLNQGGAQLLSSFYFSSVFFV